jgi:hypothetical protein
VALRPPSLALRSVAAAGLSLLAAACGAPLEVYVVLGQRYDAARDCLGEEGVIDVVEGTVEGTCDGVICLRSGETGELYVSAQCEAPPGYEAIGEETSVCAAALDAYLRGDEGACGDGG